MHKSFSWGIAAALLCWGFNANALEYEWGEFAFSGKSFLTVGGGIRTQSRADSLLYKLNIEGQQTLCQEDDCVSLTGDTAPNQRLVDAKGDFSQHLLDDGNLNYDKGDFFTGLVKLNTDWTTTWRDWLFKFNVIAFYDHVNYDFTETHPNNLLRPAGTKRSKKIEGEAGADIELRSWQISSSFDVMDREIFFSLGRQRLRWGESTLTLLNTVDVINPLDASLARQPGFPIKEAFNPVEMLTLSTDLNEHMSLEAFYQFKWRPVNPEPSGTMFSSTDPLAGGGYATLTLGQFPEDPEGRYQSQGIIGLFSNSHRTLYLPDDEAHAPSDTGQYGFAFKTYLPDFNNGTEINFYFANYHSRLPSISLIAAQESCARNSTNLLAAIDDCNGFNSSRHDDTERCDPRGCDLDAYLAREILPVDTASIFLEYPEDLKMFGMSFNTTVAGWSFFGEYSYRPDLPLQVHVADLLFAAVQPATPRHGFNLLDLSTLDPGALLGILGNGDYGRIVNLITDLAAEGYVGTDLLRLSVPNSRQIAPDYINAQYRGVEARPGDVVHGYEQLKVHQFSATLLQAFSTNPFGAEFLLFAFEAGMTYIQDMPSNDDGLYLQGRLNFTHPSVGADGTGLAAGQSPGFTFNPTQQTDGFGDEFAWGTRFLVQMEYPNVWNSGVNLQPTLFAFWDIDGIAPFPIQNYVEGNVWLIPGVFFNYGEDWSGSVIYQYFSGENNQLRDRDSIMFGLTYSF